MASDTTEIRRGDDGALLPAYHTYTDRTYPRRLEAKAVWGARAIAPNDIPHNRQDFVKVEDDEGRAEADRLIHWLNVTGAYRKMREKLDDLRYEWRQDNGSRVLYEDDEGIIVGSTQGSHGYIYVSAWLKS